MKRAAGATKKRVAKKPKNIVPDEPVDPATIIKTTYLGSENGTKLRDQFKANQPFSHIQLKDFMDAEFLSNVQTDLEAEKWYPKVNDLYTFMQTNDLKKMKRANVNKLRKALYSQEFRNFLEGITGIKLNDTIDMSAAVYSKGNQLLCHDDELEGRRIAYILYLVPEDWNQEDGGTLDLYNLDKNNQPADIVKSIVPVRNSLVFFAVTPDSHHQVSEVFSDKDRLSISGWFHGENIVRPAPYHEPALNKIKFEKNESLKLEEWINPDYFKPEMRVKINKTFARNNSINLHNFFVAEKFDAMEKILGTDLPWKTIGPANRRQYDSLGREQDNEPEILGEVKKLIRSQEFGSFLKDITGLTLESNFTELRRFVPKKGHYTLAQDYVEKDRALDFFYSFTDLEEEWGGFVTYMSEEEELLTIVPTKNSLSLVYRDELCMRFVKFITCEATRPRIDFAGMYWEDPATMNEEDYDDEENGEDEEDDEDMEDDGEGIEWVEEEDDENNENGDGDENMEGDDNNNNNNSKN